MVQDVVASAPNVGADAASLRRESFARFGGRLDLAAERFNLFGMNGRILVAMLFALPAMLSAFPVGGQTYRFREGRSVARDGWRERVERARQASAAYVGAAVDAFRVRAADPAIITVHRRAAFVPTAYLDDPTLRYGDIVAIEGRLIVFRGDAVSPHRATDFEPLDQSKTLGGIHDHELRDLDRVLTESRKP